MPASILLFENRAGQLLADPAEFLRANWGREPRTLTDTRALFERIAQALYQRNWSRVLVNQVEMQPFSQTEQHWVTTEWLPQAVRDSGYRHGAVVVSADVLVRLATAYITTSVQGLPLMYHSFERDEQAVAWLEKQPGSPR